MQEYVIDNRGFKVDLRAQYDRGKSDGRAEMKEAILDLIKSKKGTRYSYVDYMDIVNLFDEMEGK